MQLHDYDAKYLLADSKYVDLTFTQMATGKSGKADGKKTKSIKAKRSICRKSDLLKDMLANDKNEGEAGLTVNLSGRDSIDFWACFFVSSVPNKSLIETSNYSQILGDIAHLGLCPKTKVKHHVMELFRDFEFAKNVSDLDTFSGKVIPARSFVDLMHHVIKNAIWDDVFSTNGWKQILHQYIERSGGNIPAGLTPQALDSIAFKILPPSIAVPLTSEFMSQVDLNNDGIIDEEEAAALNSGTADYKGIPVGFTSHFFGVKCKTIGVTVKTLKGSVINFQINPETSVYELKRRLHDKGYVVAPPGQQKMIKEADEGHSLLHCHRTLRQYRVSDGDVIHLFLAHGACETATKCGSDHCDCPDNLQLSIAALTTSH